MALELHLDASKIEGLTDGNAVSTWADETANGRDVTQAEEAKQPTYKTGILNGLPVVRFDGGDFLRVTGFELAQPNTIFVVARNTEAGTDFFLSGVVSGKNHEVFALFSAWGINAGTTLSGSAEDEDWHYWMALFNGGSSVLRLDGGVDAEGNAGSNPLSGLTVGAAHNDTSPLAGDIAEIRVYGTALSTAEIEAVEAELAEKWGFSASFLTLNPTSGQSAASLQLRNTVRLALSATTGQSAMSLALKAGVAPAVTTDSLTAISQNRATLNGTVNPNGLSTDYWFERWRDNWESAGEAFRENHVADPLVKNGGEDDWINDFGAQDDGNVEQSLYGGTSSKCTANASGSVNCRTRNFRWVSAEPGQTWTGSIHVYSPDGVGEPSAYMQFRDAEGNLIEQVKGTPSAPTKEGWKRYSVTGTAPAGTAQINFGGWFDGTATAEGNVWFDGMLLEESAELLPFFPRPHQLASGQAVWTGTEHASSSKLATPTYHPASKEGDAGEGSEAVAVSEGAGGLVSGTTYHVRLYASNADGEAFGADVQFTTKKVWVRTAEGTVEVKRFLKTSSGLKAI